MRRASKKWAGVLVAGLFVAGAGLLGASPAQAAPTVYGTLTVSPAGPYVGGETVTLSYTGIEAESFGGGVSIGYCVGSSNPQLGPGSCGAFQGGGPFPSPAGPSSTLVTGAWFDFTASGSIPDGSVRFQIPAKDGDAGFTDYAGYKCNNTTQCNIALADFLGNGPVQIPIVYGVPATTPPPTTAPPTTAAPSSSAAASTAAPADDASSALPETGGSSTGTLLRWGVVVLMLGALMRWGASRRRTVREH